MDTGTCRPGEKRFLRRECATLRAQGKSLPAAPMFRELAKVSPEDLPAFRDALYAAMRGSSFLDESEREEQISD